MKSILIIEDDPFLLKMYKTRFEQENFKVETADNGSRALDLLAQKSFQVIILDLMLPKVGGLHILAKIKQNAQNELLRSKTSKYPSASSFARSSSQQVARYSRANKQAIVVVISSLGDDEHKKEVLALGAKEYLDKINYTPSQVVAVVKKYLQ